VPVPVVVRVRGRVGGYAVRCELGRVLIVPVC